MVGDKKGEVYLIKTAERVDGISKLLEDFKLDEFSGKKVALKANFNSADPFPASTHIKTLEVLVENLFEAGVSDLVLAERSGMGNTRSVLDKMGVFQLSKEMDFEVVVLDEEDETGWVKIKGDGNHWLRGFYISKIFLDADKVVQTCCLKTHRYGGQFTLSLKNSVGMVAKKVPGGIYNYMGELHLSPYQRLMIAEINQHYQTDLVLMDATKAFLNEGPEKGFIAEPNVMLAAKDRVALDAVGVALLRYYGTTKEVSHGQIFEQDQIKRAAELGLGVKSADEIKLIAINDESQDFVDDMEKILLE